MAVTHLLYLHGFRSSPQSTKAQPDGGSASRERHPNVHWWCPQLPPSPREAIDARDAGHRRLAAQLDGRGGLVAGRLLCHLRGRARPPAGRCCSIRRSTRRATWPRHIGEQTAWHDPASTSISEPRLHRRTAGARVRPAGAARSSYFAVIAKGDEVLDWREMTGRYPGSRIKLLEGSDHALSDFEPAHRRSVRLSSTLSERLAPACCMGQSAPCLYCLKKPGSSRAAGCLSEAEASAQVELDSGKRVKVKARQYRC